MNIKYDKSLREIKALLKERIDFSFYHLEDKLTYIITGFEKDIVSVKTEDNIIRQFSLTFLYHRGLVQIDDDIFSGSSNQSQQELIKTKQIENIDELENILIKHGFAGFYHLLSFDDLIDIFKAKQILAKNPDINYKSEEHNQHIDNFLSFDLRLKNEYLLARYMSCLHKKETPVLIRLTFNYLRSSNTKLYLLNSSGVDISFTKTFYDNPLLKDKELIKKDFSSFDFNAIFSKINNLQYSTMERNAKLLILNSLETLSFIDQIIFINDRDKDRFILQFPMFKTIVKVNKDSFV